MLGCALIGTKGLYTYLNLNPHFWVTLIFLAIRCTCAQYHLLPHPYKEGELVDHQEVLREKCAELASCSKLQEVLDACNERVSAKSSTSEDCQEELFDFVHCVEHCVSV